MPEPRDTTGNDALNICPNCDTPRVIGRHGSSDCIVALRAERDEANREIVRLGVVRDGLIGASDRLEAELERVTAERDDAYALIRHYADTDPEVALAERMRPVVEAACEWADLAVSCPIKVADAVDAYRVATSEQGASDCLCPDDPCTTHMQGRCSACKASEQEMPCVHCGKVPHLPNCKDVCRNANIRASEREASDATE